MSDFEDEPTDTTYLTEDEAKIFREQQGELAKAVQEQDEEKIREIDPGEHDSVSALKMSRVIENYHKCEDCAHLRANGKTCKAYPDGIPTRILYGEFDHILPYAGDNGINWTAKEKIFLA